MRLLSINRSNRLNLSPNSGSWIRVVAVMVARQKGRHGLAHLDDHMLDDIGLTRTMAQSEASKPFWRD